MKKIIKKAVSLLLTAVIVMSFMPMEEISEIELNLPNFDFLNFKVQAATSGTCGDNLTWTFDESTGTLTISGTGDMDDFTWSTVPWNDIKSDITTATISDGVTSIGNYAFVECYSLTNIVIPDSVTSINKAAFAFCRNLKSITIPDSVTAIGSEVFTECYGLESITIPDGVSTIYNSTFSYCTGLTSVILPDSITSIGSSAFYECTALTDVYYNGTETMWGAIEVASDNDLLINANFHYDFGLVYTGLTLNERATAEIFSGKLTYFMFVPEKSGTYFFTSCSNEDTYGYLYDGNFNQLANDDDAGADRNFLIEYNLTAGETYYFGVRFYSSSKSGSFDVKLIQGKAPESLPLGEIVTAEINSGELTYFVFIPEATGTYYFTSCSSEDTYGFIFDENFDQLKKDDDAGAGRNFLIEYNLTAGETYYFGVRFWSVSKSGSFDIKLIQGTAPRISLNERVTAEINSGEQTYFMFIPESSGTYYFISYSNEDTRAYLYDDGSNQLAENDDGGSDRNFLLEYNLTEGTVYYFGAQYYYDDTSGNIGVAILNYNPTTTNTLKSGYYSYVVDVSGNATITDCDEAISGDVVIPSTLAGYPVTKIGDAAFRDCSGLASITIPNSVTSIGEQAFCDCTSLKNVYYNGTESEWNAISIGSTNDPLVNATVYFGISGKCGDNLTWTFNESTGVLTINGSGDMYNWSEDNLAPWYDIRSNIKSVTISNGVTNIGDFAFSECENMAVITVSDTVTTIGFGAFALCTSLTSIDIPNGVTTIDDYAFYLCSNLSNIRISDGVTSIGEYAFAYCVKFTDITIPDGITAISEETFRGCIGLTSITVPDGVKAIGKSAFAECKSLTTIDIPDGVTVIGDDAFNDCIELKNITIPDGVTGISNGTFEGCIGLTSITIPNGVTAIGYRAFSGCAELESVTLPDGVITIGDAAFSGCDSLTSIIIPDGVTSIGYSTFSGCENLTSITIPERLTSIGACAFSNCQSLASINMPYSVSSIGDYAFEDCSGLTGILLPEGVTVGEGAFEDCTGITSVIIPIGVTSISKSMFKNCSALTSVTIGRDVKSIGDYAFYGCTELMNISFPDGMTVIYGSAFENCKGLKCVVFPKSLTIVGGWAFDNCTGLKDVYYNGTEEMWNAVSVDWYNDSLLNATMHYGDISSGKCGDNLTWILNETTGSLVISGEGDMYNEYTPWSYSSKVKNVEIENGVTSISEEAFACCDGLTAVTIPDSVTSIGRWAFSSCDNLTSVNIPAATNTIGLSAFGDCPSLTEICVDSENEKYFSDDFGVLYDKSSNTLIQYPIGRTETVFEIPSFVKNVGRYSFSNCENLENIVVPEEVERIDIGAFYGCINLKEVAIPENSSLVSIGGEAFVGCESLKKINFPESLEVIDAAAFQSASELVDISLPSGLKNIGTSAFYQTGYYNNTDNWENGNSPNNALYLDGWLLDTAFDNTATSFEVKNGTIGIASYAINSENTPSKIFIPSTVSYLDDISSNKNYVVYCNENSSAHLHCSENSIPYVLLEDNVKSLKIKIPISKIQYSIGEALDTSGMVFTAEYENGTVLDISSDYVDFSVTQFDKPGKKYVIAKLGDKSVSFFVNVVAGIPSSVEINELPEKLVYTVGETLDTSGLSLNVIYDNSNTKTVTEGITASCDLSSPGTKTVTVNYTENEVTVSTSYQITVNPKLPDTAVSVDSVSVSAGETISVPFRIENNQGIMGFAITVNYDSEAFTPVSVTPGEVLKTGTLNDSITGTGYEYLKIVFVSFEDVKTDGELFTVDFIVNENAIGDYSFDVSYLQADTFNEDLDDVVLECSDFNVSVSNTVIEESVIVSGGMLDAEAGTTIKVPVTVENGIGINSFSFRTKYNRDVMSFVSVSNGDVLTGNINATVDSSTGEVVFNWSGSPVVSDGVLFYIVFNIPEYVQSNDIVSVICDNMMFSGGIIKDVICIDAQVNITNPDGGLVPVIYSDEYIIAENSIIEVPIYIKNNHGIMGYRLNFEYDSSVITPISASNKMACGGSFANNIGANDGNFKVLWSFTENFYDDCLLFTVKFSVADGIKPETLPLSVTYSQQDTYNENWEDVALNIRIPQIPIRNVYTAQFVADGILVATRTFTVETEKLDEPAVPQKAGYIGAWSGYVIKAEDMVINAKYYLPEAVMISKVTLKTDETTRLLASCNFDATRKKWSSSNPLVATVDKHGNVTAVGEGKCKITVTCYGKDSFGNDIKASTKTEIVVNKPLNAETLKERFRAAFDEFFQVKLHDIVFNFKEFMIILFRYVY